MLYINNFCSISWITSYANKQVEIKPYIQSDVHISKLINPKVFSSIYLALILQKQLAKFSFCSISWITSYVNKQVEIKPYGYLESQARQEFMLKCLYITGCKSTGIVNSHKRNFSAKAVSPAVHSSGPFH